MDPLKRQLSSAIAVSSIAYLGGMVMGYPGMALAQWELPESEVHLTRTEASWFASISQLVCIPGSLIGGVLIENLGPRRMILIFLPILSLSWISLEYTVHVPLLLIFARFIQGLLYSFLMVAGCIFPCEITDVSWRHFMGAFLDVQCSLGILAAYIVGGLASWRHFGYISIAISIVPCFMGTLLLAPESPLWLVRKGRMDDALKELQKIRTVEDDPELEIKLAAERVAEEMKISVRERIALLIHLRYLIPVSLVTACFVLKESTGQIAVTIFAVQIFRKANSGLSSFWCSILTGSIRLAFNVLACVLLTKLSTKKLISFSALIGAVMMGATSVYFFHEPLGVELHLEYLPVVFLLFFVVFYSMGIGPSTWLLSVELMPVAVTSVGNGVAQAGFNLSQWVVSSTFAGVETSFEIATFFAVFSFCCLAYCTFAIGFLPETKDRSISEMEEFWLNAELKCQHLLRGEKLKVKLDTKDYKTNTARRQSWVPSSTGEFITVGDLNRLNKLFEQGLKDGPYPI